MTKKIDQTLKEKLLERSRPGVLWTKEEGGSVRCFACAHRCLIKEGREGTCKVRANRAGDLRVPWGYVAGLAVDPIEKKPFFHVRPGSSTLSFGMLGCNLHCSFCQNWLSSQTLRDPDAVVRAEDISADAVVALARSHRSTVLTSTYNEPLITVEWAIEILKLAKASGISGAMVSNGYATEETLAHIRPYVDFLKIDLKCFKEEGYRSLGGKLQHVTDAIKKAHEMGFWVEVVTLIVPGFNDDVGELKELARFLASVSREIPWHLTAFHSDYQMLDRVATRAESLITACEIGKTEGLDFVYAGNVPGRLGQWENTFCPHCHHEVVARQGFRVLTNRLNGEDCPDCGKKVPGAWA